MSKWQQFLIAFSFIFIFVVVSGLLLFKPNNKENLQPLQPFTPSTTSMIQNNRNAESNTDESDTGKPIEKQVWYQNQVVVLMYHDVSNADKPFSISPQLFREHMKFLHDNDLQPISLSEFLRFVDTGVLTTDNAVLITFDDGYESFYKEAYPILKENRFPSVNFVIAGRLRDSMERKRENMITPLTTEQVNEMLASGLVEIGSHTYSLHDHIEKNDWGELTAGTAPVYLEDLHRVEEDQEYRNRLYVDFTMSRVALSDLAKKQIDMISLPHGYQNQQVLDTAREAGYHYIFNSRPAVVKPGVNPFDIPRIGVGANDVDLTKLRQVFMDAKSKQ